MSEHEASQSPSWMASSRSRFEHIKETPLVGKVSDMLDSDRRRSLPMYKDKPYAYPASQRYKSWFQKRRTIAVIILSIIGVLHWLGLLSSTSRSLSSQTTSKSSRLGMSKNGKIDWDYRREEVKKAMKDSWAGYEKYAWGYDEWHPKSKRGRQMVGNGMGWIIVDSLDTLMLMNLTDELSHARHWMSTTLTYDVDHDVNTFETTIRMLGGLLSAHYLSSTFPKMAPVKDTLSDDIYLEKAVDLADRLMGAYNSTSGVPYASVWLKDKRGMSSKDDGGASSTAEATSVQLEMKYLAKLTGETQYWELAEKVMEVVDANGREDGLLPIFIYPDQGTFRGDNIRLGSRGDSYYEYLIKQYLQTSLQEPIYRELWNQAMNGIEKHLLTFSSPSNFVVLVERPNGLHQELFPKMDHLVCFMPGTMALAATLGRPLSEAKKHPSWTVKQDREITLAKELIKTCWGMYKVTKTGLGPEIAHFKMYDPPRLVKDTDFTSTHNTITPNESVFKGDSSLGLGNNTSWTEDFVIKPADAHNRQRPETIESLFYMWRITGDVMYREWGWEMFESFMNYTRVPGDAGFSGISDVNQIPVYFGDDMESFWLAETLKYFYLLFSPDDLLPLDQVVFNTEAHPFPRFELGKLFRTGWQRKARDKDGKIIGKSDELMTTTTPGETGVKAQALSEVKTNKVI